MAHSVIDPAFPCSLYGYSRYLFITWSILTDPISRTIDVPLPTHRLALSALRALQVDTELSPLVSRTFSLTVRSDTITSIKGLNGIADADKHPVGTETEEQEKTVLRTEYKSTTNRMLRVAVNGFMESLGVVLRIMEELDVDVLSGGEPVP